MTKLRTLKHWLLISTLTTLAGVACGDDDDDDVSNTGGSAMAGRSGSGNSGGTDSNAGAGQSSGGPSVPGVGGATDETPAVGGAGGAAGGVAGASQGGEAGAAGAAIATLDDAEILLVLDTLNQGEVEEAYAALPRLMDENIRAFAEQMVTDHGSARQAVAETADQLDLNPTPSALQRHLMAEAEEHVGMLRSTPSANVDSTYVNLQVTAHSEALALLNQLDQAADAEELHTLIATLTATVEDHHDSVVELQNNL